MSKPFKFRYASEITGAFVFGVFILLAGIVFLTGKSQGWFEPVRTLQMNLPEEGSFGLEEGAEVEILGTAVGFVDRITLDDSLRVRARLRIKSKFCELIRRSSRAIVKKRMAVAGDAYIEITTAREGEALDWQEEPSIEAELDTEFLALLRDVLEKQIAPAIEQIRLGTKEVADSAKTIGQAFDEYRALARELRDREGPLMGAITDLERIVSRIEAGEGTAGRLLTDPAVAAGVEKVVTRVDRELLARLDRILRHLEAASGRLPLVAAAVEGEAQDLGGTVIQTRETLREAEKLIESLQRHWLLRGYVERDETPPRIAPTRVLDFDGAKP